MSNAVFCHTEGRDSVVVRTVHVRPSLYLRLEVDIAAEIERSVSGAFSAG